MPFIADLPPEVLRADQSAPAGLGLADAGASSDARSPRSAWPCSTQPHFELQRAFEHRDADHAFGDHFEAPDAALDEGFELGRDRQEKQVGAGDAVDGGDKSRGDAFAQF
jgi:hypothetical protein